MADYYAISNTVCLGRYPGKVVSEHASHWEAVQAMFKMNEANGMEAMMFDPKCYELAESFLPDDASKSQKDALAQAFQDAAEDYLRDIED